MRLRPQTYALTAIAHQRRRVFQRTTIAELLIATLFRYRDTGKFKLHGFVVMPDHIHILLTPAPDHTIERCAQLIKGGFSFAVRKDHPGEIWQEGYHAHRVTNDEDYAAQLQYIANNPVRKSYIDYPHVHTTKEHLSQLDAYPQNLPSIAGKCPSG
jgi:putative transposase